MASGAAGLIYQVIWTQDLVLIFGNTTQAIVTTVTAFLSGLGLGALVGAAIGRRLRRALIAYGILEIGTGCFALLMPLALDLIATVFRNAYLGLPPGEVALIRFALAFTAMTPVTLLMGMTLPLLTRSLVRAKPQVGERVARLYGLNTLGAAAGAAGSGYVLLEILGLRGTTFVAVALNLGAGCGALLISRAAGKAQAPSPRIPKDRPLFRGRQWLLLGITFVSGFVSLAMEMLWTRLFMQATGSPIYVFVAILAVFLIGICGGSLIYERQRYRAPQPETLGLCLAGASVLALLPLIISDIDGPAVLPLAVGLILPVTVLLGYAFPLTVHLFVGDVEQASSGVGFVYAANTAGCVFGTVIAGFVLIPAIGTNKSIFALCVAEAVVGGALAIGFAARSRTVMTILAVGLIATIVTISFAPQANLTFIQHQSESVSQPHAHFEDDVAMVDVRGGSPWHRRLFVNGTSITNLSVEPKLLAYIPKILRPDSRSMLNICFGMGTTFRTSILLGLHTDAVDLDPTVPRVMHWFYHDANRYLHSALAHVIINDGRNYVRLSNKRYDLITVDPPPPSWSAGAVVLMAKEFYSEARQHLNPGGILATLLTVSRFDVAGEKILIRTFRASFRYTMVLHGGTSLGIILLGSQAPMNSSISNSAIMRVLGSRTSRANLVTSFFFGRVPVSAWPSVVRHHIWLTNDQVAGYVRSGPILTDDHPYSEYYLIRDFYLRSTLFERLALELASVVAGLLALLVIWLGAESLWRRRPSSQN